MAQWTGGDSVYAVIDIGTNSVRLLIAERELTKEGSFYRPVAARLKITRLGQNVNASGLLDEGAIARTCQVLREYQHELNKFPVDNLVVTATSAVRDGANREEFLAKVKSLTGWDVQVLTGEQEAAASFVGATKTLQGLGFALSPEVLVLDIGGGSTELTCGTADGKIVAGGSIQAGAVRMTELGITRHPVSNGELKQLQQMIRSRVAELVSALPGGKGKRALVGVGGTITTLAALELKLTVYDWAKITGMSLTKGCVEYWLRYLAGLNLAERAVLPGMSEGRGEIIVAGAAICNVVMDLLAVDQLMVSDGDLMQGMLYLRAPAY